MVSVEEAEVEIVVEAMAEAAIVVEAMAVAMAEAMAEAAIVVAVMAVEATDEAEATAVEVIAVEAMAEAVATVVVILNLILPIPTNLQEQMVGKIEVMVILLKILNTKVVEVGEKGVFQMRRMQQMRKISNPFFQV